MSLVSSQPITRAFMLYRVDCLVNICTTILGTSYIEELTVDCDLESLGHRHAQNMFDINNGGTVGNSEWSVKVIPGTTVWFTNSGFTTQLPKPYKTSQHSGGLFRACTNDWYSTSVQRN